MALVVITGGARSGKSTAAERLALVRQELGACVIVAVFGHSAHGNDAEFAQRIAKHRADRPQAFATLEGAADVDWLSHVDRDAVLVVDCLGTLLGRVMEDAWERLAADASLNDADADVLPDRFEEAVAARFDVVVETLLARLSDTIVVTNEVGEGIVPAFATGRLFRDLLGRANRALVDGADAAYLAVAGRLIDLSALPREASWPQD